MMQSDYKVRQIKKSDNESIEHVIRTVLIEYGLNKAGTAFQDKSLNNMHGHYQGHNRTYWIVEFEGEIIGGAGIAPLEGGPEDTCELQKMYFKKEHRGKGLGSALIKRCLDFAQKHYTSCYLETVTEMKVARMMYRKFGFTDLEDYLGDTGHSACSEKMIKPF